MSPKHPLTKPKALFVEGKDEERFLGKFSEELNLRAKIEIFDIGGKTKLATSLDAVLRASGHENIETVAVVRDADDDAKAAFDSVCGALASIGLAVPTAPLIMTSSNPKVGVMILPG